MANWEESDVSPVLSTLNPWSPKKMKVFDANMYSVTIRRSEKLSVIASNAGCGVYLKG